MKYFFFVCWAWSQPVVQAVSELEALLLQTYSQAAGVAGTRVGPANGSFVLERGKPYTLEHWYFFHRPLASVFKEFLESRRHLSAVLSTQDRQQLPEEVGAWKERLAQACLLCSVLLRTYLRNTSGLLAHMYTSFALPQATEGSREWLIRLLFPSFSRMVLLGENVLCRQWGPVWAGCGKHFILETNGPTQQLGHNLIKSTAAKENTVVRIWPEKG